MTVFSKVGHTAVILTTVRRCSYSNSPENTHAKTLHYRFTRKRFYYRLFFVEVNGAIIFESILHGRVSSFAESRSARATAQFVRSAVGSCGMAQVRRENPLNAAAFRVRGGATRGSLLAARIQSGFTRHRRYNGPPSTDNVSRECVMMRGRVENREGRW